MMLPRPFVPGAAMNLLVTAGNTQAPIDRVRCITNIFTGRTGAAIAKHAHQRGHTVTLLTSHPEAVSDPPMTAWTLCTYRTFDELRDRMSERVRAGAFDAVVHCAAVSDYVSAGVYAPAPGTHFTSDGSWQSESGRPTLHDRAAGKVKSDEPELWLRLARAPKLIDMIRGDWGFGGLLVKFKLEVGVDDERLLEIAQRSRIHSAADLMVANTLEGASAYAFIGPVNGRYERVSRRNLAPRLLDELERLKSEPEA
jgi:phosphopantothenoylcysteine synthetase/decarboxylase